MKGKIKKQLTAKGNLDDWISNSKRALEVSGFKNIVTAKNKIFAIGPKGRVQLVFTSIQAEKTSINYSGPEEYLTIYQTAAAKIFKSLPISVSIDASSSNVSEEPINTFEGVSKASSDDNNSIQAFQVQSFAPNAGEIQAFEMLKAKLSRWYYTNGFLIVLFSIGLLSVTSLIFALPLIVGIVLYIKKMAVVKKVIAAYDYQTYLQHISQLEAIQAEIAKEQEHHDAVVQKAHNDALAERQRIIDEKQQEIQELDQKIENKDKIFQEYFEEAKKNADIEIQELINNQEQIHQDLLEQSKNLESIEKKLKRENNKLSRIRNIYDAVNYAVHHYTTLNLSLSEVRLPHPQQVELDELSPTVSLNMHAMDIPDLRKAYRDNDKEINKTFKEYESRYNTKANIAIYKLMVVGLRSELQNVLANMKYDRLDKSIESIREVTAKYSQIASEGNQSIATTLGKFIGVIEYLFQNAVQIEYTYYKKREEQKAEQAAIREQMKQEAAERKELARQKAKLDDEEQKYNNRMEELKAQLRAVQNNADALLALNKKISELQAQINDISNAKEEIVSRQNGKAGNVYIISNTGSFGDNVFKIGMTRRLDPEDRIRELSSASVPFPFDVHSFIFSKDAVALENKLHTLLDAKRVNKVNMRKEFFKVSIADLEELVHRIDPTAEFTRTILAEEYHETLQLELEQKAS